jgi:hypothetical protein
LRNRMKSIMQERIAMKKVFASLRDARRQYRRFKKQNRFYRIVRYSLTGLASVYISLLIFPQIILGHQTSHRNLNVYAASGLDKAATAKVLRSAEARLLKSPVYDRNASEKIFLAGSHGLYTFFTLDGRSFGSTQPFVGNILINKADASGDLVFRSTAAPNERSLSGVIAHEVMHNQLNRHLGPTAYLRLPEWKNEGYAEYVAGETTLSDAEGIRLWKEGKADSPYLAYFKYRQMVKYLLEVEKIGVEDFLAKDFDEREVERKAFAALGKK